MWLSSTRLFDPSTTYLSKRLVGHVDASSVLGPYNLKEGQAIYYNIQLSSPPLEFVKVCADIISSPKASSLKINVIPRCVNFITGTEKIKIAVKSKNDHIDALVDHQLFSIIHYVKEAQAFFTLLMPRT